MTEKHLCIGGPKDGQWIEFPGDPMLLSTVTYQTPVTVESSGTWGLGPVYLKKVLYDLHRFRTPDREFWLWIIHGMSETEAMEHLLANYRPTQQGANNG